MIIKIFTFINLQLMPSSWGSQWISPLLSDQLEAQTLHIQVGRHHKISPEYRETIKHKYKM